MRLRTRYPPLALALTVLLVFGATGCKKDRDATQTGAVGGTNFTSTSAESVAAHGPRRYRVIDGGVTYSGESNRSCTYPNGECRDYDGGYREASASDVRSIEAKFSMRGPTVSSTDTSEIIFETPLRIDSWDHGYDYQRVHSHTPCNAAVTDKVTDSSVQHRGGPSAFVVTRPGDALHEVTVSLRPLAVPPSEVREEWTGSGGPCSPSMSALRPIIDRSPFDFYPSADRTRRDVAPTYTSRGCNEMECIVRAEGTNAWTYVGPLEGDDLSGRMTVEWWFDIEVRIGAPCDPHRSSVEYGAGAHMGQDLFSFFAAVPWCADGERAEVEGSVDGTRGLFPDGVSVTGIGLLTVPLEGYLGIEFEEKAGDVETWTENAGGGSASVTIDSPGYEACASPVDILLAVPPIKAAFGAERISRLTAGEREALLRNIKEFASLPESVLKVFGDYGAVVNDIFIRMLTATTGVLAGQALDNLDDATDVCVDVWQPVVTFVLNPDGSASVSVYHDDNGVDSTTHERQPLATT